MSGATIARLDGPDATYAEFRTRHLETNSPCVFSPALVAAWPLFDRWVTRDRLELDYDYLRRAYGQLDVECASLDGDRDDDGDGPTTWTTTFRHLVNLWQAGAGERTYLRDWHLPLRVHESADAGTTDEVARTLYSVPDVCLDDWINEYEGIDRPGIRRDDFRFVYAGGRETFTPLHRDVYCSYSISTQIYGRKLWYLFPPSCTRRLEPLVVEANRAGRAVNCDEWTDDVKAEFGRLGMTTVYQEARETIFIPSGWYHSVHNLTHPTVSLNHNWLNAHNLAAVYGALAHEAARCRLAIDDVRELLVEHARRDGRLAVEGDAAWKREWETQVDQLVERSEGWSWTTFWKMVANTLGSLELADADADADRRCSRWPTVPPACRPPTAFVVDQVRPLVAAFRTRREQELTWLDGLARVLDDVDAELDRLTPRLAQREQQEEEEEEEQQHSSTPPAE
ncbi:hypothetical protein JCM11491_006925 [Sporobolomyces phaffii]